MAEAAKKKAPSVRRPKGPDAELVKSISADVENRLDANMTVDTMPHGAQEGLFGGKLGEGLKKAIPGLVKAVLAAGADGKFDASDVATLVFDLLAKIRDKNAGAA